MPGRWNKRIVVAVGIKVIPKISWSLGFERPNQTKSNRKLSIGTITCMRKASWNATSSRPVDKSWSPDMRRIIGGPLPRRSPLDKPPSVIVVSRTSLKVSSSIPTLSGWLLSRGWEGVVLPATSHFSPLPSNPTKERGGSGKKSARKEKTRKWERVKKISMRLTASQKSRYTSNRRYAIRIKKKKRERKKKG